MILMYLRKSRSDDPSLSVSEVLQKHFDILQELYVKRYGKPLEERYIFREVVSGETIADRIEIQRLLEFITNNDVSEVYVVEPQRLSRGDLSDCGQIVRVFEYSNTKITTPLKTFDLTDKYDKQIFISELQKGNDYLEYMKTIMERGRIRATKEGQYFATVAPFGYDKVVVNGKKTLKINSDGEIVKLIYSLALQGKAPFSIATELDKQGFKPTTSEHWAGTSVRRILQNQVYIGKVKYGERKTVIEVDKDGNIQKKRKQADGLFCDGLHPALIDVDTFNAVQRILSQNTREPAEHPLRNPFASIAKCGICGKALMLQVSPKCAPRMTCVNQSRCHNKSILYSEFFNEIYTALKDNLEDFETEIKKDGSDITETVKTKLKDLEKQESKQYDLLEKGIYSETEFINRRAKLNEEKALLQQTLDSQPSEVAEIRYIRLSEAIESLKDKTIPPKAKNLLLRGIIKRIEYTRTGKEPFFDIYF